MSPHVARPAALLEQTLRTRLRALAGRPVEVACTGTTHRLAFDGRAYAAVDHDEQAEAVLRAVGGDEPACTQLVRLAPPATAAELWTALSGGAGDLPLTALPATHLRVLLAQALQREFAEAGEAVRDSVGQLGLALLGDPPPAIDTLAAKFQITRELPHWDPGPGPWTDRELVLLHRCSRTTPGDDRPHLELLPRDPVARRAVATYAASLLDPARVHREADLRAALSHTFRNVKALTALLVKEGALVERDGGYRVTGALRRPGR